MTTPTFLYKTITNVTIIFTLSECRTHLIATTFITFASKNVDAVAVVDSLSDLWDLTGKGKDTITVSIISSELGT